MDKAEAQDDTADEEHAADTGDSRNMLNNHTGLNGIGPKK